MGNGIAALLSDPHRIALLIAIAGAVAALLAAAAPWLQPDPLARQSKQSAPSASGFAPGSGSG